MTPDLAEVEAVILDLTNAFRAEQWLGALKREQRLDRAARDYAGYLARTGKFSHTADGRSFSDRIRETGYQACIGAENLALNGDSRGFASRQLANDAVEGWKASPGHRKNMMLAAVTEIGVGVAKAPREQTYLSVQLFGRPQALKHTFRIRNDSRASVALEIGGDRETLAPRTGLASGGCQPVEIKLLAGRGYALASRTQTRFVTGDGDTFVIVAARDGSIEMRHVPRTR